MVARGSLVDRRVSAEINAQRILARVQRNAKARNRRLAVRHADGVTEMRLSQCVCQTPPRCALPTLPVVQAAESVIDFAHSPECPREHPGAKCHGDGPHVQCCC
jgi:hypothetical protein